MLTAEIKLDNTLLTSFTCLHGGTNLRVSLKVLVFHFALKHVLSHCINDLIVVTGL